MNERAFRCTAIGAALLFLSATTADAYIGPGAGLSAIGSVVSVVSAMFLAIAGFIWYPIKRLFRRKGTASSSPSAEKKTALGSTRE